jgi:hypothetical protein
VATCTKVIDDEQFNVFFFTVYIRMYGACTASSVRACVRACVRVQRLVADFIGLATKTLNRADYETPLKSQLQCDMTQVT